MPFFVQPVLQTSIEVGLVAVCPLYLLGIGIPRMPPDAVPRYLLK